MSPKKSCETKENEYLTVKPTQTEKAIPQLFSQNYINPIYIA